MYWVGCINKSDWLENRKDILIVGKSILFDAFLKLYRNRRIKVVIGFFSMAFGLKRATITENKRTKFEANKIMKLFHPLNTCRHTNKWHRHQHKQTHANHRRNGIELLLCRIGWSVRNCLSCIVYPKLFSFFFFFSLLCLFVLRISLHFMFMVWHGNHIVVGRLNLFGWVCAWALKNWPSRLDFCFLFR